MARTGILWLAATGCAVTLSSAVPQAGQRPAPTPAAKPAATLAPATKIDPRVAKLKDQLGHAAQHRGGAGREAHHGARRSGMFKDVDLVMYNHVGSNLGTGWGDSGGNGLTSLEYLFEGETAHSAGAPWRGRSALDAVELMNVGWNYRREHLRLQQRSHYVITNGGDQPNVENLWDIADKMAQGATLMTNTSVTSRVLGSAWPSHMNRTMAGTLHANITQVGLPQWSEADLALATATQKELKVPVVGLVKEIRDLRGAEQIPDDDKRGGGSDDIGDISWTVPTVSLSFPANFQAGPGHN